MSRQARRAAANLGVDEEGHFLWCGERYSGRHWNASVMGVGLPVSTFRISKHARYLPSSINVPGTVVIDELHPDAKLPWPIGRHVDGGKWLWRRPAHALSIVASIPATVAAGLAGRMLTDAVQLEGKLAETPLSQARIMRVETKSTLDNVIIFHLYPEKFL